MSTIDTGASANGRGSETWSQSWTHLNVDRRSRSYCRVTFDHPPINTITATTVAELAELVGLIEQDPDLNVVVFDSANPDFYLAHYDTENDPSQDRGAAAGPTGMHAWLDLLVRLSRAPIVSIASIRGRARGAGSEFVLACDLRFASRENTLLGQFEVGTGVVPGGGPDGPALPLGRSWPGARDPARRRRSRRAARGAVRLRQPGDRRRPARRRGRRDRLTTRALRSRRDGAHQVLCRPGDVARRQRVSARRWPTSSSCWGGPCSRGSAPANSWRDWIPSLANTWRRCHSTVRRLRKSRAPISGFERPSRASSAICRSCGVRSSRVSTVRLRPSRPSPTARGWLARRTPPCPSR